MKTKFFMSLSAIFLGAIGIFLTFLPTQAAGYASIESNKLITLVLQILGALYFGFAMLNWMARGNLIGGIYSRPVAIANFTHFFVGGLALIKTAISGWDWSFIWVLAIFYLALALFFGKILFTHPLKAD